MFEERIVPSLTVSKDDFTAFPEPEPAVLNVARVFALLKNVSKNPRRLMDESCRKLLGLSEQLLGMGVESVPVVVVAQMPTANGRAILRFDYRGEEYSICHECFSGAAVEGLLTSSSSNNANLPARKTNGGSIRTPIKMSAPSAGNTSVPPSGVSKLDIRRVKGRRY